jgi:hypothetical protein
VPDHSRFSSVSSLKPILANQKLDLVLLLQQIRLARGRIAVHHLAGVDVLDLLLGFPEPAFEPLAFLIVRRGII